MRSLSSIIFLLFLLLPDIYIYFNKIHLAFSSERMRWTVKTLYFSTLSLQVGGMVFLYLYKANGGEYTGWMQVLDAYVKVIYAIKIFIIIPLLLLGDAYRGAEWLLRKCNGAEALPERVAGRREFMKRMSLMAAALPFGYALHGITKGKFNFQVRNVTVEFDDLPPAFDGFRIAHFSDFHAGSFESVDAVRKGLSMIQEQATDLILFTGDLVNEMAEEMDPFTQEFSILNAPYGQYACTGNHDYGYRSPVSRTAGNRRKVKEKYGEANMTLLNNEHVTLEKGGEHIHLLGVENWGAAPYFPKEGDLDGTLDDLPSEEFKILLSHDPTHWDAQVRPHTKRVQLTLSGHTHGAQMGVEWLGMKWSPGKYIYKKWAGLYEEAGEYLYINRGFGMLEGFYMRIGMYPEITVLELRKKVSGGNYE